ncbi:MAG: hypothetical protein PWR01_2713 [Clostridiales bacterium]|nr:hypothetical protein [Clostridiales bacterium]MDN5281640.1 hypothetical protein [Candidatus Ozemobacter sp.]
MNSFEKKLGIDVLCIFIFLAGLWLLRVSFRDGKVTYRGSVYPRDTDPIGFWLYILSYVFFTLIPVYIIYAQHS